MDDQAPRWNARFDNTVCYLRWKRRYQTLYLPLPPNWPPMTAGWYEVRLRMKREKAAQFLELLKARLEYRLEIARKVVPFPGCTLPSYFNPPEDRCAHRT